MNEVITPGLVAELRDSLRDLLVYVDDPASAHPMRTGGTMTLEAWNGPSPIAIAEQELDALRRKGEVVARAKRLSK